MNSERKVKVARPYDTWDVDISIAATPDRDVEIVDGLTGLIESITNRVTQDKKYLGCKWVNPESDNTDIRLYAFFSR